MNAGTPLAPDPELPPELDPLQSGDPHAVGPYRLVGRLGAGGMGAVYGGLDERGQCVAVKTVHADFARKSSFREAFAREVEMLGRAGGISTARLHDADPEAAVPWLAFDYVPGRDLRTHVRAFGPLEGDMLRTFALGVAEGLVALHAAGIAHRDIKPGNVILSPQGPKIVDFGIAVEIGTERSADASASYGTPGWVAPERYSGAVADPSADVFAWGGLVTLAATGQQPFGTGGAGELARRVREGAYDVDGVPEDLLGLVEAALSAAPGRRPSSEALMRSLLPEPVEGTEGRAAPPQRATDSLRRMLHDYWRGVDAAGHEPGRWAAALGAVSAVGLGASALGSSALGSGGASGTGTAAGTTAGGATTAAGGGATGTGLTSGGALSGVATSTFGLAGAGLLAVAGLGAGGFVVYDQVRVTPGERIAAAASLLEEGQGFTAQVERVPVGGGEAVTEEYLYSAETDSFLIRGAAMGPETTAVANHQGDLYVYAPREEAPGLWEDSPQELSVVSAGVSLSFGEEGDHGLWQDSPERLELAPDVGVGSVDPTLVTAPLRTLAGVGGAEAVEGQERVYEGHTVLGLLDSGDLTEEEASGRVELDGQGAPVRADYATDRWEVRVDFAEVDTGVVLEDPQVWAADQGGFGWAVAHAPICGTVRLGDWASPEDAEKVWDVQASGWDVGCDYAMDVAELREDPMRDPDRHETLHAFRGTHSHIRQFDDTMACGAFWHEVTDERGFPVPSYVYGPCQEASVLTSATEEEPYSEVEFGPVTRIDFHEQT